MRNGNVTHFVATDTSLWLADLLFQRHNRSMKYDDDGRLLILSEMSAWTDIWPRLRANADWIGVFVAAILINFILFVCSLKKARKHVGPKKLHCYIGSLAFCNVIIAAGALVYMFLVDIYYDVDSFTTLVKLNRDARFAQAWHIVKRVVHTEMVEGFALAQSLVLLSICADRYFSLLNDYTPYVKHARLQVILLVLLPYVLALNALDEGFLSLLFSRSMTTMIRMAVLVAGPLLSVVFISSCLARRVAGINKRKPSSALLSSVTSDEDGSDCGTCLMLMLLVCIQLVEKAGFFLELLRHNFMVELVVGEPSADATLRHFLAVYYKTSHVLFLSSPLLCGFLIAIIVPFYRDKLLCALGVAARRICCQKEPHLDYSCETMRSIIAEQNRLRQMHTSSVAIY